MGESCTIYSRSPLPTTPNPTTCKKSSARTKHPVSLPTESLPEILPLRALHLRFVRPQTLLQVLG